MSQDNVNAGDISGAIPPAGISSSRLEEQLHENAAIGQTELTTDALIKCSENLIGQFDALNGDLLATLRPHELKETERLLASVDNMLREGKNAPLTTLAGTDEHRLALHMREQLPSPLSIGFMERGRAMLDFIGGVLANDFTLLSGNAARRVGNGIAVATRTGAIVVLTTLLRQMVGFTLEQQFHSLGAHASLTPRMVAGIASLLIGPGLNLAGALRDEKNGTATVVSRISRISMAVLSLGGLIIASAYDPVKVLGLKMAAIGPQMAAFTLARDFIQTFFPLHENGGTNLDGLLCSSFMYGIAQVLLSEGMMNLAPQSGAEYLVAEAARLAGPLADWSTVAGLHMYMITPNLLHDLLRSAMNTAVEVFDELQRPALMRYFATRPASSASRRDAAESAPLAASMGGMPPSAADGAKSRSVPASDAADRNKPDETIPAGEKRPRVMPDPDREGVRIGLGRPRIGTGHWPTSAQFADNMLTTCAMRTSVFEAVMGIALTVSAALDKTRLAKMDQCHILSAVIGGLVMVGYPVFLGAHLTGSSKGNPSSGDSLSDAEPAVPTRMDVPLPDRT